MGLIKAFSGAISGTLADQWKDIVTADSFDEVADSFEQLGNLVELDK